MAMNSLVMLDENKLVSVNGDSLKDAVMVAGKVLVTAGLSAPLVYTGVVAGVATV